MLPVYEGHSWNFIEEHIHDVLGKLDLDSGRHHDALHHFAAIIACPSSPAYWQAFYLKQFLDCVRATVQSQVRSPHTCEILSGNLLWGLAFLCCLMVNFSTLSGERDYYLMS